MLQVHLCCMVPGTGLVVKNKICKHSMRNFTSDVNLVDRRQVIGISAVLQFDTKICVPLDEGCRCPFLWESPTPL